MNHDALIKITNKVALWASIALFYWTLIFTVITVFNLKVFREHMTETFFMSIFGIFALLSGALILNVMSNLSKISAHVGKQEVTSSSLKNVKWWLLSFPIIIGLLFGSNMLSEKNKEGKLVRAAESVLDQNPDYKKQFADYEFNVAYINKTAKALEVIQKIDKHFPSAIVIQKDQIDNKPIFLAFNNWLYKPEKATEPLLKHNFIFTTGSDERNYLTKVFEGKTKETLFIADKYHYQLFYPVSVGNKRYVIQFSDRSRYGRIGS